MSSNKSATGAVTIANRIMDEPELGRRMSDYSGEARKEWSPMPEIKDASDVHSFIHAERGAKLGNQPGFAPEIAEHFNKNFSKEQMQEVLKNVVKVAKQGIAQDADNTDRM